MNRLFRDKAPFILPGITALMLLAIITGVTGATINDPEASSDNTIRTINNWYDLAWHWRKPVTISNGGSALSNYQIKLTVNTQTLIGAGKMQSNGNDIRFTASDGVTLLDYWIESGIGTTSTYIWVEVTSIPAGNSTIYLYYGNSSAAAASSGYNTFIFFDDFEDDLSRWSEVNAARGDMTQVTSPVQHLSYAMYLNDTATGYNYGAALASNLTTQTQCVVEFYARPAQANDIWEIQVRNGSTIAPHLRFHNDATIEYNDTAWRDFSTPQGYTANTWYEFRLDLDTGTDTYDVYINGSQKADNIAFNNNVASINQFRFVTGTASETADLYVDLVKFRAYAATVPTGNIGAEE
jgi:hypothetical protein